MYYATAKEMQKLDDLAVRSGLQIRQMMELAGWRIVPLLRNMGIPKGSKITIAVGKGNKGGDGLSAARHLTNNGWSVSVILLSERVSEDARHHLNLIKKMGVPVIFYQKKKAGARNTITRSDVLIDALIGYNLQGHPRGPFQEVIGIMNGSKKKIFAYDLPSGIDATSGECLSPCIRAHATLSLAIPKRAFKTEKAENACGRIFVADIGIPKFLYDMVHRGSRPRFGYLSGLAPV